jgi:O-antigen/teichoic acid export membrane protein
VLTFTAIGALLVLIASRWIVKTLYSSAFLPSVAPLQILLPGVVALGVSRVLSNDLFGRGRPGLSLCVAVVTVVSNVALNALWIPQYGIAGAALASSASYSLALAATLWVYCRISRNPWTIVMLPQRGDWMLYWRTGLALLQRVKARSPS